MQWPQKPIRWEYYQFLLGLQLFRLNSKNSNSFEGSIIGLVLADHDLFLKPSKMGVFSKSRGINPNCRFAIYAKEGQYKGICQSKHLITLDLCGQNHHYDFHRQRFSLNGKFPFLDTHSSILHLVESISGRLFWEMVFLCQTRTF